MGATASIDIIDTSTLTAPEVAECIGSIGPDYDQYKPAIVFHGLDGKVLSGLVNDEEIDDFFDELEIIDSIHRKTISTLLRNLQQMSKATLLFSSASASVLTHDTPGPALAPALKSISPLPFRTGKQTHVFFAYSRKEDELRRNNHIRIMAVNNSLKVHGFITCFEEDMIEGSIRKLMMEGIDSTLVMVVFMTQSCLMHVKADYSGMVDERDSCRPEIIYGIEKLGLHNIVIAVMEPRMRNYNNWTGELGETLTQSTCIDLSDDFPDDCVPPDLENELVSTIKSRPNMTAGALASAIIMTAEEDAAELRTRADQQIAENRARIDDSGDDEITHVHPKKEFEAFVIAENMQADQLRSQSKVKAAEINAKLNLDIISMIMDRETDDVLEKANKQAEISKYETETTAELDAKRERLESYNSRHNLDSLVLAISEKLLLKLPANYIAFVIDYLKYAYSVEAKEAVISRPEKIDRSRTHGSLDVKPFIRLDWINVVHIFFILGMNFFFKIKFLALLRHTKRKWKNILSFLE
jgi:hypothetical protein